MFYHVYVTGQPRQGLVLELKHKMGQLRFAELSIHRSKQERRSHWFCGRWDTGARSTKLEYLGWHDALTGLFNRARLEQQLKRLMMPASSTVLTADLDGLKLINDTISIPMAMNCSSSAGILKICSCRGLSCPIAGMNLGLS